MSYASAFQTLHAYLALHGCVVVDPAHVEGELPSPENAKPAAIAGRLTKAGGWKFERIHRTPRSRWKELHRIWGNATVARPTTAFDVLFSYLYRGRWKVPLTLDGLSAQLRGDKDVRYVVETGGIIERYPGDLPYPSRLMLGWVSSRPIHVVAADNIEAQETIVITVYEADSSQWEAGFRRRRPS